MSDPHGHGSHDAGGPAGPADFPPVPATRWLTPAPEDYRSPFPGAGVAWPFFWLLVCLALFAAADAGKGSVERTPHGPSSHGE